MTALSPLVRSFVAHFGEMGSRWGINRTVGQIYALIFVSPRPLNADEIAEQLEFSRSNVSMGLKELQAWRLVNLRHLPSDRREYFDAPSDAWDIFRTLAEERRRREIEPTLSMLRNALLETPATEEDRIALERMRGMHDLIELTTTWFDDVQRMDQQTLAKLMRMGAKVQKVLEFTGRMGAVSVGKISGGKSKEPTMDAFILARMQFAANITFHILFPTISLGLGWLLLFFRWRWLQTRNGPDRALAQGWLDAYRFWTKVFALSFALGVVSGITMSFQFGTNWPGFMEKVGNIAGPLLGYEVMTAFFLEAGFLGVMLFGHGKVSEKVHFVSTFFVAFGTTLSTFWILALNSWMQTPAGYEIIDGVYHVKSWIDVVFNPSFPYRFTHMTLASALTCAFLLIGLSAWQTIKGVGQRSAPRVMRVGLTLAAIAIPLQILAGDAHGLNTLEHQPQKIAAMEGVWDTERGAPLLLFAIPDNTERKNHFEIKVPKLASLILTHDLDGEIKGLNEFKGAHPPPLPLFFAFRAMVGIGMLMLAVSWVGWWLYRRAKWQPTKLPPLLLWVFAGMTFSGWVATVAGWYVTEIGRQPFIVYGLIRTADVVSTTPAPMIGLTLALYVTLYLALIVSYVGVLKYMAEKPEDVLRNDAKDQSATPAGAMTGNAIVSGIASGSAA